ncbi:hypothetical protein EJB05_24555 [Eragrostis curvula]|uniref:C2H2-type domain-containing protein n=1 Tax=Eragrostis curvula TaxID=38414 RepID=A0A5J9VAY3_9POAL|nr:hypothetical protein EJB05_24555 [Eragrostis curvula]
MSAPPPTMSRTAVPLPEVPPEVFRSLRINAANEKRRRPAGTPDDDMDTEVLALSPRALLEPGHLFVCDVCGRRYNRVHSLHRHRRLHGVASGNSKTPVNPGRKTRLVFVCPEPTCRRHDPAHAIDNFPRIKKHFRHWHGHLATGSSHQSQAARSMEHQDTRDASQPRSEKSPSPGEVVTVAASQQQLLHAEAAAASSASPSCGDDLRVSTTAAANAVTALHGFDPVVFTPLSPPERPVAHNNMQELQLMPPRGSCARGAASPAVWWPAPPRSHAVIPQLELSLWFGGARGGDNLAPASVSAARLKQEAREQLRLAAAEKAAAELARAQARRQAELAGHELAVARRVRQQAQVEFASAHELREHAVRQVHAAAMRVQGATCFGCRHKYSARAPAVSSEVDDGGGRLRADRGRAKP